MKISTDDCTENICNCAESKNPDEWRVNSEEHGNCFWRYLRDNPRTHTLQEVADLLGMSISAITNIEKKALKKVSKRLKRKL